jgi:hypothetical protein
MNNELELAAEKYLDTQKYSQDADNEWWSKGLMVSLTSELTEAFIAGHNHATGKIEKLESELKYFKAIYHTLIDGAAKDTNRINELQEQLGLAKNQEYHPLTNPWRNKCGQLTDKNNELQKERDSYKKAYNILQEAMKEILEKIEGKV